MKAQFPYISLYRHQSEYVQIEWNIVITCNKNLNNFSFYLKYFESGFQYTIYKTAASTCILIIYPHTPQKKALTLSIHIMRAWMYTVDPKRNYIPLITITLTNTVRSSLRADRRKLNELEPQIKACLYHLLSRIRKN